MKNNGKKTAILIDGGFFRKRYNAEFGIGTPKDVADFLNSYCWRHLKEKEATHELYRIFYYDCPPIETKVYHPYTKKTITLKDNNTSIWMKSFLDELKTKRKFALRMGSLSEQTAQYNLKKNILKKLFRNEISITDITQKDFIFSVDQKGVDMKIGLDISSLAYKKQVDKIILISGDSDFIPAAKLARIEGIDFVLDSLGSNVKTELYEHIDGLRSVDEKFKKKTT